MKKLLLFFGALTLLTACQGEPGRDGINGKDGKDGTGVNWQIIDVDIQSKDWQYTFANDNNYYYAVVDVPELTDFVYNNGNISVYLENTTSNGGKTQNLLPSVRHYEVPVTKTDTIIVDGKTYYNDSTYYIQYTQTTDYEYWSGQMEFYITNSDFYYDPSNLTEPGDKHFRIVLTY